MNTRTTLIFGSALMAAAMAVTADHHANTAASKIPLAAQATASSSACNCAQEEEENYTPCGAR